MNFISKSALLVALSLSLGSAAASAATSGIIQLDNYLESFDGASSLQSLAGWTYVTAPEKTGSQKYEIDTRNGVDDSHCLKYNYNQFNGSSWSSYNRVYFNEYMITPLVKGKINFKFAYSQSYYYSSEPLEFAVYKATENADGTFSVDTTQNLVKLVPDGTSLTSLVLKNSNWYEPAETPTLDEYTHLAFKMQWAQIDDFSADGGALVPETRAISLVDKLWLTPYVEDDENGTQHDLDEKYYVDSLRMPIANDNGKDFTVMLFGKFKNAGNVDLAEGDPENQLILFNNTTKYTTSGEENEKYVEYGRFSLPAAKIGETVDFCIVADVAFGEDDTPSLWNGTTSKDIAVVPVANEKDQTGKLYKFIYVNSPKALMTIKDGYQVMESGKPIYFDKHIGEYTLPFCVQNNGCGRMVIESVDTPEGVSVTFPGGETAPYTFEAKTSDTIRVTLGANGYVGKISGDVVFNFRDADGVHNFIRVDGVSIAEGTWFEGFESGSLPMNWLQDETVGDANMWRTNRQLDNDYSNVDRDINHYYAYNTQTENYNGIVTPKVAFKAGETLNFTIARATEKRGEFIVSYSADRENWTEIFHSVPELKADSPAGAVLTPEHYIKSTWSTYAMFGDFAVEMPEGEYYLQFKAGSIYLDNIYGGVLAPAGNDVKALAIESVTKKAFVNAPLTISAKFRNIGDDCSNYSVALYANNEKVAELDPKDEQYTDFISCTDQTFTLSYVPHRPGLTEIKMVYSTGEDYTAETAVTVVNINEESSSVDYLIGDPYQMSGGAPITLNYNYSRAEWIIPAEMLTDLVGKDMSSMTFFYSSNNQNDAKANDVMIKLWVAETDATEMEKNENYNYFWTEMPEVYNPGVGFKFEYTNPSSGYSPVPADATGELACIFNSPVKYTGKNLRVSIAAEQDNNGWASGINFLLTNNKCPMIRVQKDDRDSYVTTFPSEVYSSAAYIPVVNVGTLVYLDATTGTVVDGETGAPVANATISARSGDVWYDCTTDAEGKFSMEVFQKELEYTVTVTADKYLPFTGTLNLGTANSFTLERDPDADWSGIDTIISAEEAANSELFNLNGVKVNSKNLSNGVYIRRAGSKVEKVIVK